MAATNPLNTNAIKSVPDGQALAAYGAGHGRKLSPSPKASTSPGMPGAPKSSLRMKPFSSTKARAGSKLPRKGLPAALRG